MARALAALANRFDAKPGENQTDAAHRERAVGRHIGRLTIRPEDIPDSHFENNQRIIAELGYGQWAIPDDVRAQEGEIIAADQASSLQEWANYLTNAQTEYPNWFRYWVFDSVAKMGVFMAAEYDDQGNETKPARYGTRTKETTAPFAELNREALAYVHDAMSNKLKGESIDDEKLNQLAQNGNFSKLYTLALSEVRTSMSPELRKEIRGSWRKFNQIEGSYSANYDVGEEDTTISDNTTAKALTSSLRGFGTGWCTAGTKTAEAQLADGDFYVYYTKDADGDDTVPRIAIRMEDGQVAEVRGVAAGQNLEGSLEGIASEMLQTLPGGDKYYDKVADMKQLTDMHKRWKQDQHVPFTADELRFLYEIDRPINSFGYGDDPRIDEMKKGRDKRADLALVFGCPPGQITLTSEEFLAAKDAVVYHYGHLSLGGLKSAEGLTLPEAIGDSLDLSGLTSAEDLTLPGIIYGGLYLGCLTSAEGLSLPEEIGGDLNLSGLTRGEVQQLKEKFRLKCDIKCSTGLV